MNEFFSISVTNWTQNTNIALTDESVSHRNEDHEDFIEVKTQQEAKVDDTEDQARPQGEVSSQTDNNTIINVRELKSHPLEI